jgi:hypothetical protein
MSDGIRCTCDCHKVGGSLPDVKVEHVGPCCVQMACGENICFGFQDQHIAECPVCLRAQSQMTNEPSLEGIDEHVQPRRIRL